MSHSYLMRLIRPAFWLGKRTAEFIAIVSIVSACTAGPASASARGGSAQVDDGCCLFQSSIPQCGFQGETCDLMYGPAEWSR